MFFKKLGLLLSGLFLAKCDDGSLADYYTYHSAVKETPAVTTVKDNEIRIHCGVADAIKITDLKKTENIILQAGFSGLLNAFPKDLSFEFYVDDKPFPLPDTIHYSVSTVIDGVVRYFSVEDTSRNVVEVVEKLKRDKEIPENVNYYSVSGNMKFSLNNKKNPEKICLKFIAKNGAKKLKESQSEFELKQPRLYKTRSRPYG